MVYRVISSPATYTMGAAGTLPALAAAYPRDASTLARWRGAVQAKRRVVVAERRRCIMLEPLPSSP